jgi:hypothetical protein
MGISCPPSPASRRQGTTLVCSKLLSNCFQFWYEHPALITERGGPDARQDHKGNRQRRDGDGNVFREFNWYRGKLALDTALKGVPGAYTICAAPPRLAWLSLVFSRI